jgi:hypothetical protein
MYVAGILKCKMEVNFAPAGIEGIQCFTLLLLRLAVGTETGGKKHQDKQTVAFHSFRKID